MEGIMSLSIFPGTILNRSVSSHPLFSMQRELNRLFDDVVGSPTQETPLKGFSPRIDIIEDEKSYQVSAELPGVEEKDIHLAVKDNLLSISAEKKSHVEKKENGSHYSERLYGKYERSLTLGENVNEDGIEAHFKNGVLHISIPKKEKVVPAEKKIEVKSMN